jgi:hypothetical protein
MTPGFAMVAATSYRILGSLAATWWKIAISAHASRLHRWRRDGLIEEAPRGLIALSAP